MKLIITENYDDLSKEAFDIILDIIRKNPYSILGLATGSTPLGLYKMLIDDYKKNKTNYSHRQRGRFGDELRNSRFRR